MFFKRGWLIHYAFLRALGKCFLVMGILAITNYQTVIGQEIRPGGRFTSNLIGDNREYKDTYQIPQTIFGIRSTGYGTLHWDSTGMVGAGIQYFHEFGSGFNGQLLQPILFLELSTGPIHWRGGSMPRKLTNEYPRSLIRDSIQYFRPYLEGLSAKWNHGSGYHFFWIDWTSRQRAKQREVFVFGFSGEIHWKRWMLDYEKIMHHKARQEVPDQGNSLRDNGGSRILLGRRLNTGTFPDSLVIKSGMMVSYDRLRGEYGWRLPKGWFSEVTGTFNGLGTTHQFYVGEGHDLLWGDPFYRAGYYSRHDLFYLYEKGPVTARFTLSFHVASRQVHSQQLLDVTIDLP